MRRIRLAIVTLGVGLLVVACGGDDDTATGDDPPTRNDDDPAATTTTAGQPPTTTAGSEPPTTSPPAAGDITLTVEVDSGGGAVTSGSLTCAASGASGTGSLADPQAAAAACDLLRRDGEPVRRLVEGPRADLLCTEIYGGPEVARVTGQITGRPVDASFNRTDGCGIADWDGLSALLAPAY